MPKLGTINNPNGNGGFKDNPQHINKEGANKVSVIREIKNQLAQIPLGEKLSYAQKIGEKIMEKALIHGDMNAIRLIVQYIDGLPRQEIKMESNINVEEKDIKNANKAIEGFLANKK